MKLQIDVFADLACPWCYVGEKRLERALERHQGLEIEQAWHPFQLQPDMPAEGMPWQQFAERKFGGMQRARALFQQVIQAGAGDGIAFDFERMPKAPNTRDAHRLILWAGQQGKTWPTADALFRAYFSEAKDVTDRAILAEVAGQVGLPEKEAQAFLAGQELTQEVSESQDTAERMGISGVPFFIFDRKVAVSGAQPVEQFDRAIQAALKS